MGFRRAAAGPGRPALCSRRAKLVRCSWDREPGPYTKAPGEWRTGRTPRPRALSGTGSGPNEPGVSLSQWPRDAPSDADKYGTRGEKAAARTA